MSKPEKVLLRSQTKEFVIRLRLYFERERQNGGPIIPVEQVVLRVADALQIGRATVIRITREKFGRDGMEDNKLKSPPRTRNRLSKKDKINTSKIQVSSSNDKQIPETPNQQRTIDKSNERAREEVSFTVYAGDNKKRQLRTPSPGENIINSNLTKTSTSETINKLSPMENIKRPRPSVNLKIPGRNESIKCSSSMNNRKLPRPSQNTKTKSTSEHAKTLSPIKNMKISTPSQNIKNLTPIQNIKTPSHIENIKRPIANENIKRPSPIENIKTPSPIEKINTQSPGVFNTKVKSEIEFSDDEDYDWMIKDFYIPKEGYKIT